MYSGRDVNMGIFLNTAVPYEAYKRITSTRFFVDKTRLLCELLEGIKADGQRYVCVTRPRRFGKTVMAAMIASFLEESVESGDIFDKLAVSEKHLCREYQNKYDVFYMDLSRVPENCSSYEQYILRVLNWMKEDLSGVFSDLKLDTGKAVWDILAEIFRQTKKKFVFVLDEWDAVFHMPFVTVAEQVKYLDFLKNLLKDQEYVELAYMTGILPIAKYFDGSELNMFDEYDMAVKEKYGQYFGFSEEEVDVLFDTYISTTKQPRIKRNALWDWYDGYHTASGPRLYNPRSVVCALRDNQLANYWTSSGTYDSIFHYMRLQRRN